MNFHFDEVCNYICLSVNQKIYIDGNIKYKYMKFKYNRRTVLQMIGSSAVIALAGCTTSKKQNESQNQTPVQGPTRDDFKFDMSVKKQFSENHPARINTTLSNISDSPITISTGPTPPFTTYLSGSESDKHRLILNPNVSEDRNPLDWIGENDPIPNTDENLCWNVPQDVTIDEISRVTEIEPEETIRQTYDVYRYQSEKCLQDVDYEFKDTFSVEMGAQSTVDTFVELELEFTLTIKEDQSLYIKNRGIDVLAPEN